MHRESPKRNPKISSNPSQFLNLPNFLTIPHRIWPYFPNLSRELQKSYQIEFHRRPGFPDCNGVGAEGGWYQPASSCIGVLAYEVHFSLLILFCSALIDLAHHGSTSISTLLTLVYRNPVSVHYSCMRTHCDFWQFSWKKWHALGTLQITEQHGFRTVLRCDLRSSRLALFTALIAHRSAHVHAPH